MADQGNNKVKIAVTETKLDDLKDWLETKFDAITTLQKIQNGRVAKNENNINMLKKYLYLGMGGLIILEFISRFI